MLFVTLHHPLCSMCGHGEVCRTPAVNRVAACGQARYGSPVADSSAKVTVNPVAGRRNPLDNLAHIASPWRLHASFLSVWFALWRLCVGRLRPGRVPSFPVFLPHAQLPPNPVGRIVAAPEQTWSPSCRYSDYPTPSCPTLARLPGKAVPNDA